MKKPRRNALQNHFISGSKRSVDSLQYRSAGTETVESSGAYMHARSYVMTLAHYISAIMNSYNDSGGGSTLWTYFEFIQNS